MRKKLLLFFQSLLILSLILSAFSFIKKDELKTFENYKPNINNPIQKTTTEKPFQIIKNNIDYKIFPEYEYEIEGIVVSTHTATNWWEIKSMNKWGDYLNIKDICIIWGDNIKNSVYKNMTFASDEWACYAYGNNKSVTKNFNPNQMSNNHLLTSNPEIMKKIFHTKIGDIVNIKGLLVDYCYDNCKFSRKTSTKRTDKGDGSCETIFVKKYKIINSANKLWEIFFAVSKMILLFSIAGIILINFLSSIFNS